MWLESASPWSELQLLQQYSQAHKATHCFGSENAATLTPHMVIHKCATAKALLRSSRDLPLHSSLEGQVVQPSCCKSSHQVSVSHHGDASGMPISCSWKPGYATS
eukprot:3684377-Amphidinium_carterae.1